MSALNEIKDPLSAFGSEKSFHTSRTHIERAMAFMACNRWRDKCVDAEAKLEAAEKRIAELEAREVNLPPNELVTDTWTAPGDGWEVFDAQKVINSIRSAGVKIAAGITVKGE